MLFKVPFEAITQWRRNQYTTRPFVFFLKQRRPKNKIIYISYLIIVLIKLRLFVIDF